MDTGLSSPTRNIIANEVEAAVSNTKQDILNSMAVLIDSRLNTFQANIQQNQQDISDAQMSKIEESVSDNYKFQRKGNENQYKHSVKVISKLKEARTILDNPDMNTQKVVAAKEKISEGISLIQDRQKMIKLADSSELGWRVVQEYESNPIADDSEDEKRTNRALSKAERKAKAEKLKRRPKSAPYIKDRSTEDNAGKYKPGRCFTCGKKGHWSDSCPDAKKSKLEGVLPFYPFERLNNHNFINLTGQDLKKTFDFIADFNSLESDVILATFLKSGSHWVHEIITMLLTQNSSKYNNGPLLLDTNLGLIDEKTAATFPKPRLFHTHFSFQYLPRKHVENGYKIVQLNRNPKDRHVSMYHFMLGKTGVPDWTWADYFELFVVGNEDLCGGWFNDTKEWLDAKKMYPDNIFLLQYEQLIKSPQNTVTNLAKFLDVPYTDSFVNEVIDKCSFEKLKENKIDASRCIHPEGKSTLFREGKIGGWKKWFTVSQNERFDELYKTEMAGYDVDFVYT